MSQTFEFYNERANEAAADAKKAKLANVRRRLLRAERSWRGLAARAKAVAEMRTKVLREKAAERDAEAAKA
ncbi:hypothetical protein QQS45_08690 [Alteriqipengyuania flavescens]|uniref:hypothetical protein n=1 Tax=Alteriqipengyuania flavescens TaxID=3053610 RepID=UPI0025B2BD9D|nr:hypothetical protein [Alteriqipengyuania flavescens]WJY17720.1 hypothetical protein QQW98_08685 [Alteriqipengyuania flavescens]WJY23663.1 hypothetical protein QQS45_08690 [Alteriqipengyuania flavescens]